MLCLSVKQPWASALVRRLNGRRIKDIENRTWSTTYRGPLLIHASKRIDLDALWLFEMTRAEVEALPRGGIIGMVILRDCVIWSPSPWFEGPIGWYVTDPLVLPFQPCRGHLGLFEVTPEEAATRALIQDHLTPLFR